MSLGERLYQLRKRRGLSQEQVAEQLDVARQTISKWETDVTVPDFHDVSALADLYEVDLNTIAGKEENKSNIHSFYWEYKSKRMIGSLPLVHINVGLGLRKAKGVIAIGNIAEGILSIGIVAIGLLGIGALSLSVFALAGLAIGLLIAVGGVAVGSLAIGGLAFGLFALGGFACGIYSIGGCAFASRIALGGYASAPIAIGDQVKGTVEFITKREIVSQEIRNAIVEMFPHTWKVIVDLFTNLV